jgi:hypothetical protein
MPLFLLLVAVLCLSACSPSPEARLRRGLRDHNAIVRLPPGTLEVSTELQIPEGARDLEIVGAGDTVIRAAPNFRGRAILTCGRGMRLHLRNFRIEGNASIRSQAQAMAPSENYLRVFYANNGILADGVEDLEIRNVHFQGIANFAILVSRSRQVRIEDVVVEDSGSLTGKGRNNTTGGILIEEGTSDFQVVRCTFRNIRGNGVWTHSLYRSPRGQDGLIAQNRFDTIGRDAIQVGHATRVRVIGNRGTRIGFPAEIVDAEGGGTPVAIDTAGNVDQSVYMGNQFQETNGKCIDLDGFHDGEVRANICLNRLPAESYAFGHFGIVMNNTNPDMQSQNITIAENRIEGTKFGGIFVIGSGHQITGNRLLHLNTAGCNESAARFGCFYFPGEPELLESGIYLGRRAERAAVTRSNVIRGNFISGHKMKERCIAAAPGVRLGDNLVERNTCTDE